MAYEIIYKKRFVNKLIKLLNYLEIHWDKEIAVEFLNKLDKRIETLKTQPFIGKQSASKPEIRTILITKHNRLYYKITQKAIIIVNMYDTRKDPEKNIYE